MSRASKERVCVEIRKERLVFVSGARGMKLESSMGRVSGLVVCTESQCGEKDQMQMSVPRMGS